MTTITASLVKELREKTGVGMMDCKKALSETNGDFEEAITYLREKGLSAAAKKSDRETKEGRVFVTISADAKIGSIVEVGCETDFVANNEAFSAFGNAIAAEVLAKRYSDLTALEAATIDEKPFATFSSEAVLKLGENLGVRRVALLDGAALSSYIHSNGKIGILVAFTGAISEDLGKDVAMQVAAAAPICVRSEEVPTGELEKEKSIVRAQLLNEGKPEAMVDKIVEGKILKYYKDVCLLEQTFVKDQEKTVKQILPANVTVSQFIRFSLV
jgi:elongation factor Ts